MHLRWEWVKWDAGVITLKLADDYDQKTDTERLIPLEPELRRACDEGRPYVTPEIAAIAAAIDESRAGGFTRTLPLVS